MATFGACLESIMEDYIILKRQLDCWKTEGFAATLGAHLEALMKDNCILQ
jgi:hypothetical protein